MASNLFNTLFISSLLLLLQLSSSSSASAHIFLPVTKHPLSNQHLTQIFHTSQLTPTTLLLDLNSPFLYLGISSNIKSPSAIPRRSIQCSATGLDHQSEPLDEFCSFNLKNPVTSETTKGELVQEIVSFGTQKKTVMDAGAKNVAPLREILAPPLMDEFCHVLSRSSKMLTGFTGLAKGVVGLGGMNRVGVVEQVSHSFGLSKKFTICLSSSSQNNGMVLFGEDSQIDVYRSMLYTPIHYRDSSYQINLKSIRVQNKKLSLNQPLSTLQISTTSPYTLMESKVYKEVIKAFAAESEGIMGMNRADGGKFELCYNSTRASDMAVPVIDLVLQSEMVKWRIYGHNSMVKMSYGGNVIMCLGILDGGDELGASVVLGSHQLEDNLVEIDLGRSMYGFTSSLLINNLSCSFLTSSLSK